MVAFTHAAEQLSFVSAGRLMGISASAMGKSIAKLETELGVRLFQRSTRQISLTEEGKLFYQRCRCILDDIREAEAAISSQAQTPTGKLRISLPNAGYRLLMDRLPDFQTRYPKIELELDFNDRMVDIIEEGYDAVIRSGDLQDSRLVARKLMPLRFLVCAAPAYLHLNGTPAHPRELQQHACLHFRLPSNGKLQAWCFKRNNQHDAEESSEFSHARPALVCNSVEAILSAAVRGLGLAYLPYFVAREALQQGLLQTVLEPYEDLEGAFWLIWPASRHIQPRLKAFIDFLCTEPEKQGGKETAA
jgi:DNA-binding transcriptional LysR family regulator